MARMILAALAAVAFASPQARAQSAALAQLRAQAGPSAAPAVPQAKPAPTVSSSDALSQSLNDEEKTYLFTAADYARLKSQGKALRAAPGSDWVPAAIAAGVLSSIDYAFANGMADELSWKDFFHGHVELDRGASVSPELARLAQERSALASRCAVGAAYSKHLHAMGYSSGAQTPAAFARDFYSAPPCDPASLTSSYLALLNALVANPGMHILFHTRETTHERFDPPQAKRTIMLRAGKAPVIFPLTHAGEESASETVAGSIQIFFFVSGSGEVVFYPSEDIFLMQRGWFYDEGLKAPF